MNPPLVSLSWQLQQIESIRLAGIPEIAMRLWVMRVGVGGALAHITLNVRFTTVAINVERKERSPNIPRLIPRACVDDVGAANGRFR